MRKFIKAFNVFGTTHTFLSNVSSVAILVTLRTAPRTDISSEDRLDVFI